MQENQRQKLPHITIAETDAIIDEGVQRYEMLSNIPALRKDALRYVEIMRMPEGTLSNNVALSTEASTLRKKLLPTLLYIEALGKNETKQ